MVVALQCPHTGVSDELSLRIINSTERFETLLAYEKNKSQPQRCTAIMFEKHLRHVSAVLATVTHMATLLKRQLRYVLWIILVMLCMRHNDS